MALYLQRKAMFVHNKRLQYTVRVAAPDPGLAIAALGWFDLGEYR
jgi:hypothetical protein